MAEFDTTNWHQEKIKSLEEAGQVAAQLKAQGKKVVTVNGSFDILHAGHLDQLEDAKKQGDVLFVGVNSDASVREAKGRDRPYIPQEARAAMVAALSCVDYVLVVEEAYHGGVPQALVRAIKPNVHVNGPDYGAPELWLEYSAMQEVGAVGYSAPRRNALSTTRLIAKIRS